MITFEGNKQILKPAKLLEANARNLYPHVSTSRIRTQIGIETPDPNFFVQMKKDYAEARKMIKESGDIYAALAVSLREGKVGNCTEDAMFAELLGKINGQKNIYTGSLGLKRGKNETGRLNHVIAFITDKPVKNSEEVFFKNKEAIIIDPWLGITDFAGNYFTKLKSIFRKTFMYGKNKKIATFSNDNLAMELIRAESKTIKEFNSKRREYCPHTNLSIFPFVNNQLSGDRLETIKEMFPELVLKNYKKISMPEKKAKIVKLYRIA